MKCFLCYSNQWHQEFEPHATIGAAKEEFLRTARQLWNYGQFCAASLHIAQDFETLREYPDYVLRLNKNGNLLTERT